MTGRPTECTLCGNRNIHFEDSFWVCDRCEYQFALKDASFSESYYQKDIGLLAQNILEEKGESTKLRKYAYIALEKIGKMNKGLKVCDIGCGTGLFLKRVKQLKNDVYGYDINKYQSEYANKKNGLINVTYAQSLSEYCKKRKIQKNFFDVITCFEVIEHIYDVNTFLEEIRKYLKPGGVLLLSTPNNERIQMKEKWDYPPVHVSRFKRRNMEKLLEKYKLQLQIFQTFNELGYYSGNFLAKMKFSQKALEHMVSTSGSIKVGTAKPNVLLFRLLAKTKKTICTIIDIPIYLILLPQKNRGHTMFLVARKIK